MIKKYKDFPQTVEFEGQTYYKIKGTKGQSYQDSEKNISQRYTKDELGEWQDGCPLYMNSKEEIIWD